MTFSVGRLTAGALNDAFGASASDAEPTSGTTTSTSYTSSLTGGTGCVVTFVAPTSGNVVVINSLECANSGATFAGATIEITNTGTGSVHLARSDNNIANVTGTSSTTVSRSTRVTGLTPGTSYTVTQFFKVGAGTGTFLRKELIVMPTS